jgi:hypothetical protein
MSSEKFLSFGEFLCSFSLLSLHSERPGPICVSECVARVDFDSLFVFRDGIVVFFLSEKNDPPVVVSNSVPQIECDSLPVFRDGVIVILLGEEDVAPIDIRKWIPRGNSGTFTSFTATFPACSNSSPQTLGAASHLYRRRRDGTDGNRDR